VPGHAELVLAAVLARLHCGHFDDTRNIVVETFVSQLDALGQTDRLRIFRLLVRVGPQGNCVEEIRRRVKMPGSTLSHHLDALARCGLLTAQRSGRFIYYSINWGKTAKLIRFLTEDCCADLHRTLGGSAGRSASANGKR